MRQDLKHNVTGELERLQSLTLALEARTKPSLAQIQDALESGCACLISLEASAQGSDDEDQWVAQQMAELHSALSKLRELSSTQPSSWRTLGFVLSTDQVRSGGAAWRIPRLGPGWSGRAWPGC